MDKKKIHESFNKTYDEVFSTHSNESLNSQIDRNLRLLHHESLNRRVDSALALGLYIYIYINCFKYKIFLKTKFFIIKNDIIIHIKVEKKLFNFIVLIFYFRKTSKRK